MPNPEFPNYAPVYPLSKSVTPRQARPKLPSSWGIEQRKTIGQNQAGAEYKIRWRLEYEHANIVDAFLDYCAQGNLWFYWTNPNGVKGKYYCSEWTKEVTTYNVGDVQATFKETFDFADSLSAALDSLPVFLDGNSIRLYKIGNFIPTVTGVFSLTGNPLTLSRNYVLSVTAGTFSYAGGSVTITEGVSADYFSDWSAQNYGWQAEYEISWWAS